MPDRVTYAVRMSSPPKQMLVVAESSVGANSSSSPSRVNVLMPPVRIVATLTLPSASMASESKYLRPSGRARNQPLAGTPAATLPGASRSKANMAPWNVSATYTRSSSGEMPTPFGPSMGKAISSMWLPSALA